MSTQAPTKERGWPAYAHEVCAILDDRQTQFRRVVKPQPKNWNGYIEGNPHYGGGPEYSFCPFGKPGDRLWLKEEWAMDQVHHLRYPRHGNELFTRWFAADESRAGPTNCNDQRGEWRSSVYMPRWAARINVEVTDVRVERVQDISDDDAELEGIDMHDCMSAGEMRQYYKCGEFTAEYPSLVFEQLWDSINKKRGFGWDVNPFVWCVSFERIEQ